jgi:hypothetical protein
LKAIPNDILPRDQKLVLSASFTRACLCILATLHLGQILHNWFLNPAMMQNTGAC